MPIVRRPDIEIIKRQGIQRLNQDKRFGVESDGHHLTQASLPEVERIATVKIIVFY